MLGLPGIRCTVGICLLVVSSEAQQPAPAVPVHLSVEAGTPLRLYLTKRVFYKAGAPVTAKFVAPVWSFDRITIPAGSTAAGSIVALNPVPRFVRAMSIIRGDFTPLKQAEIAFDRITLPDGSSMSIRTQSSTGLGSFYTPPKPAKKKNAPPSPPSSSKFARLKTLARQQAEGAANGRSQGLFGMVHAPDRKEWLQNFALAKLPYHPQWYGRGARFDAVLTRPLDFGTVEVAQSEFGAPDAQPGREQAANLRLTDTVTSADAKPGDPIHGILAEPLFTPTHQLVLPEGAEFSGRVTLAKQARYFHRGGKLRFTFNQITTPPEMTAIEKKQERTQAQVSAVEQGGAQVAVDEEGTAKATESKTRFLRPVVAGLIAAKSLDNDEDKAQTTANSNYSGRGLGGFSGFGLFGSLVVLAPKPIGAAFGFYGLAWSAYSTVVSRGQEVTFQKNTAVQIRFGNRQ